ncbi:type II toxin-antitoxin system HicA family toxin [Candidatus Roizmanbacteria bacterium]|nr:type II toxin-antitoxin system HicA family toxin [Candidatus Roizmanbacteria bacterium]
MPKLYSGKQVVKTLQRAGFSVISQKGSHVKLRGFWNGKLQTVIVPAHKELARGTFQSILNQAGMTNSEFEEFVR